MEKIWGQTEWDREIQCQLQLFQFCVLGGWEEASYQVWVAGVDLG